MASRNISDCRRSLCGRCVKLSATNFSCVYIDFLAGAPFDRSAGIREKKHMITWCSEFDKKVDGVFYVLPQFRRKHLKLVKLVTLRKTRCKT